MCAYAYRESLQPQGVVVVPSAVAVQGTLVATAPAAAALHLMKTA